MPLIELSEADFAVLNRRRGRLIYHELREKSFGRKVDLPGFREELDALNHIADAYCEGVDDAFLGSARRDCQPPGGGFGRKED